MRVLITGGRGQLAADLQHALRGHEVSALGRDELDITDQAAVDAALEGVRPEVVINTAAYHKVDLCESEPEASFAVNAASVVRLAQAAGRTGALLVHFSTDYVFDGTARVPYPEGHPVHPLSVYGASKAAGEMGIRAVTDRHLIVRTTGLYGLAGRTSRHGNFPETMVRVGASGKPLTVVADQVMTPSATRDVARAVALLIETGVTGTAHVTNSGACSWYEFAREIFRLADMDVNLSPTTQDERPLPARRPAYSVLDHGVLRTAGLPEPPPWQEALARYMADRA